MADTDESPLSIASVWSPALNRLMRTNWEDADDADVVNGVDEERREDFRLAALALKYAHDTIGQRSDFNDDPEMAVLATVKAARKYRDALWVSPADVCTMADNFVTIYDTVEEPLQEYLDEHHEGIELAWLNDEGIGRITSSMRKDSEIWQDESALTSSNLVGVWVFRNPDFAR